MLLAIDWGNSNLRAAVLDGEGRATRRLARPDGCIGLSRADFPARLAAIRADLGAEGLPALACGAVGAREGWVELPYVALPAAPLDVAARLHTVPGAGLDIVPGLAATTPPRAVMRGEESQLAGLELADGRVCLPGTHSKWVTLEGGRVTGFRSYQTGEMFALVTRHSRIAAPSDANDLAGFDEGLARAEAALPLTAALFSIRTDRLLGVLPDAQGTAAVAGLLIGTEVGHALSEGPPGPITLCGDPAMTRRYARALARHGVACREVDGEAAVWRGLAHIARAAGLHHG